MNASISRPSTHGTLAGSEPWPAAGRPGPGRWSAGDGHGPSAAAPPTTASRPIVERRADSRADRVRALLEHLRLVVHYAPVSQRTIETRAGFSRGYLSQILHGRVEVKMVHLLAVVRALDLEPSDFFAELFGARAYASAGLAAPSPAAAPTLGSELTRLYGVGLQSLDDLLARLERCERALRDLEQQGLLASETPGRPPVGTDFPGDLPTS